MSPPASVTITQLEPVIFLRGQSSSGEDARGRRRPVNIDAPPSQLRALVTVYLPKPSKIKEITVSLKGTAKTDWPEGIGPNRVEMAEEISIFQHNISLYNAKQEAASQKSTRPRSNSVGPGIGLQEDVDWDYAAARASATQDSSSRSASNRREPSSSKSKDEDRPKSSGNGSGGSNLARQIAGAAAKAGTAMIPPTLRADMASHKSLKESNSSRSRPPLNRSGSGNTSWSSQYATSPDSTSNTPAQSPPARFHNPWARAASGASSAGSPSNANTPATSFFEERDRSPTSHQDLSGWHEYFQSQGHERPPLYAPNSAPCDGYNSWPAHSPGETPPASQHDLHSRARNSSPTSSIPSSAAPSASATPMDRTAASSVDAITASTSTSPSSAATAASVQPKPNGNGLSGPSKSILHTQPASAPRPRDQQTVRFDPNSRVNDAQPVNNGASKSTGAKSAPSSRRSSVEIQKEDKHSSKGKSSSKISSKAGLKTLINGLLKEPTADHKGHAEDAHSDSKEFKKGTYTYPISISLPSNLPPTLHADFGFNRYVLKANVIRAGPLTPNLVAEKEITLIHAPDEDALEETDSIVVERCWEDLLSYMVVFSGKSFPVGQKIPLWLKFVPLGKVKIYRIIATLEERTDYFAKGRRVARHEVPRKWTLMKIGHANQYEPILPIISDSPDALDQSPLAPLAQAAAGEDEDSDALPSILDATGPWELATELMIPRCGTTRINISTNHSKSNIAVHHLVRLSIRVGKSQGEWEVWNENAAGSSSAAKKENPQLYDIIIEAPITLTASHTATEWTALPSYWSLPAEPEVQDVSPSQHLDAPLRPALPSPVLVSRTGMVGSAPNGINRSTTPTPLRSPTSPGFPTSASPPMSRNPTELSRRWLALSADHIGRDGSNTGPGAGSGDVPPPAYRPNARTGETTVASTSMNNSNANAGVSGNGNGTAPSVGLAH